MNRKPENTIDREPSRQRRRPERTPDPDDAKPRRTESDGPAPRFPERHEPDPLQWRTRWKHQQDWDDD